MFVSMRGTAAVRHLVRKVRNFDPKPALEDCATIFENSTKVGYLKHITPNGAPWPKNVDWWEQMKGNSSPLTGVTAGGVSKPSFPWVAKGNKEHMKNMLIHKVSKSKATIFYKAAAAKRAEENQKGGVSEMEVFHYLKPSTKIVWKVKIQEREHLGIALRFRRLGTKTDPEHFEDAFLKRLDKLVKRL